MILTDVIANLEKDFKLIGVIDLLNHESLVQNLSKYKKEMLKSWEELPPVFSTSATAANGRESVLTYIETVLAQLS